MLVPVQHWFVLFQCVNHERSPSLLSRSPVGLTTQTASDVIQHPHSCRDPLGIHRILPALAKLVRITKVSQSSVTGVPVGGSVPVSGHGSCGLFAGSHPLCPSCSAPCCTELAASHRLLPSQQAKPWLCIKEKRGKQEA